MKQKLKTMFGLPLVGIVLFLLSSSSAHAATTIVVNSNADTAANDGACTLHEAIIAANTDTASGGATGECSAGSGVDTINFAITGSASFINGGQNGYTIDLSSSLPDITQAVTINGYSQPGSRANTAPSPQPFNGRLLIELDGTDTYAAAPQLNADNTTIKGLVINRSAGTGFLIGADNIVIQGNYIGVDPTGLVQKANFLNGINGGVSGFQDGDDTLIGGSNPEDRNIISGNNGAGITPNTGNDGWVIKGNYVGMSADGVTPISNSEFYNGPGGLSIDNCDGTVVGGAEPGAGNLISGNLNFGIFPDNTGSLVIQGNIIGPDWKGDPIPNNTQPGGIGLVPINGNIINTIIGGTEPGSGNLIAYNDGPGVAVLSAYFAGNLLGYTDNAAILGNSIHSNNINTNFPISQFGTGIDLLGAELSGPTAINGGVTLDDPLDADTGTNDYMNFPVLNTVSEKEGMARIQYSLDAADSPVDEYRVEFFANDVADPTNYGEGQYYLGAITTTNGVNKTAEIQLSSGFMLAGKAVSATTTAVDSSTLSGFGSTSEFSRVVVASSQSAENQQLASSGDNIQLFVTITIFSLLFTTFVVFKRRLSH